jgi:hypothetical protein
LPEDNVDHLDTAEDTEDCIAPEPTAEQLDGIQESDELPELSAKDVRKVLAHLHRGPENVVAGFKEYLELWAHLLDSQAN